MRGVTSAVSFKRASDWRGRQNPDMPKPTADLRVAALVNTLHTCPLFAGLPQEDLEGIAAFSRLQTYGKGEYVFRAGEPSVGFYVVRTGTINVHRIGANGKEQVIHLFREGESFAEAALASETGYPADARAIEASDLILVPKTEMLQWVKRRPDLALRMLASMSQHLRVLVSSLDDLTLKDVETRVLNWLVKRCPKPLGAKPVSIELGMTKTMLAAELSTRGETLSRTLAKLREEKLIAIHGKRVEVLQPLVLQKLLLAHLGEQ